MAHVQSHVRPLKIREKVLFTGFEKLSLPSMAVGEKQKETWAAKAIISFHGTML
jgi:hypothetical protein